MQNEKFKRTEMNVFVRCAIVVFVVASIITSTRILMKYNDYKDRTTELELKKEKYSENIENIQHELDEDFNDDYVEKVAKEKLNLCMPDEAVYYNGLN